MKFTKKEKEIFSKMGKVGGKIGGKKTAERGKEYYSEIGKKGANVKRLKREFGCP
jgi:general stress protein YciG